VLHADPVGIEIRELTPDDWQLWRSLRQAALADAPSAFGSRLADWQGEGDREDRWRERLNIAGSYNIVATLHDEPIGMASGVPAEMADTVELISMWVAPSARGHGVGDALMQRIDQWASRRAARVLRLNVAADNPGADRLYRRNGFAYTGEDGPRMPDGARQRVMAKDLPPLRNSLR
jgi:GNAT superfamily N-acetyltransferase